MSSSHYIIQKNDIQGQYDYFKLSASIFLSWVAPEGDESRNVGAAWFDCVPRKSNLANLTDIPPGLEMIHNIIGQFFGCAFGCIDTNFRIFRIFIR